MAVEVAKGKHYSLALPHLAISFKVLGDFCVVQGGEEDIKALVHGDWWLGMYSLRCTGSLCRKPLLPFLSTLHGDDFQGGL